MGRLFWKFFFVLMLAQTLAVFGVGMIVGLTRHDFDRREHRPPRPEMQSFSPESPPSFRPGEPRPFPDNFRPQPRFHIPELPLISGLAASLVFAALLAWYFARPIRSLSRALEAASRGNLSIRLSAEMGGRRDELADLGRDFDSMAERLQSLMDGQRRLFHDVSHELRSPLARLQVAIGLARQQPDRMEQTLMRVERESVRMDQLVSELLTLARLESGMVAGLNEEIDLVEFVGNVMEDSRVEADAKRCTLRLDVKPTDREIRIAGNAELLRRGVENILRNAIKHSPEDEEVLVSMSQGSTGRVEVSILDHGNGVSEIALPHIFQPFFRDGSAQSAEGHGLGLAIAQRVVAMHGGSIQARNAIGGGFKVQIDLPLRDGITNERAATR